jgi:ATP-dependent Clp protease ATP-binding subunit ClpC
MWQKFNPEGRAVFFHAQEPATLLRDGVVDADVLLLALLHDPDTVSYKVLMHFGVSRDLVSDRIRGNEVPPSEEGVQGMQLSKAVLGAVEKAEGAATLIGDKKIGSGALLLGLVKQHEGTSAEIFAEHGMSFERTMEEVERISVTEVG